MAADKAGSYRLGLIPASRPTGQWYLQGMRWLSLLAVGVVACGPTDDTTRGPVASIVKTSAAGVRLHAVRHRLELAALPAEDWIALPATGTVEVDAAVKVPAVDGRPDYRKADGTIAVRSVGPWQLGDDVAMRPVPGQATAFGGLNFGHLAIDALAARLTVADGHARLTRWSLASPDVELDVDLDVTLERELGASRLLGCIRLEPTAALKARDPSLHTLLSLLGSPVDDHGRQDLTLTGTIDQPRIAARLCNP